MSTDNVYVPEQGALSDLRGWIAGELGAALVRLYVSNTPYLPTRVPADYTEASFVGYAPQGPLAWPAPVTNGAGKAESDSPVVTFDFAAGAGTAIVYGIFVTDPSATVLLLVVPFQAPVTLSPASPQLQRVLQVTEVSEL
jgi:hypothetical protein